VGRPRANTTSVWRRTSGNGPFPLPSGLVQGIRNFRLPGPAARHLTDRSRPVFAVGPPRSFGRVGAHRTEHPIWLDTNPIKQKRRGAQIDGSGVSRAAPELRVQRDR
jgi:hypothetical protein